MGLPEPDRPGARRPRQDRRPWPSRGTGLAGNAARTREPAPRGRSGAADGDRRLLRGERVPLLRLPFLRVLSVSQKNVLLCCFAIGAWLTGREVPFLDLSTAGLEQAVHVRSPIHGRTTPTPSRAVTPETPFSCPNHSEARHQKTRGSRRGPLEFSPPAGPEPARPAPPGPSRGRTAKPHATSAPSAARPAWGPPRVAPSGEP